MQGKWPHAPSEEGHRPERELGRTAGRRASTARSLPLTTHTDTHTHILEQRLGVAVAISYLMIM